MKPIKIKIRNHSKSILIIAALTYTIFFFSLSVWKYNNFQYNGLDLAIFNQTFSQSCSGDLFGLTIHPHKYLGDHVTPILLPLLPAYCAIPHPLTLLSLQTLWLAGAALLAFLVAKKIGGRLLGLTVSLILLVNPILHSTNLYEFHLLPLIILFGLWVYYLYQQKKFFSFILVGLLTLTIREDAALLVMGFGLLALLDKRSKKWIFWPILISSLYFLAALKVGAYFSPADQYKFLSYYAWLGTDVTSLGEAARALLTNPTLIVTRLLSPVTLAVLFVTIGSFGFLPLLAPRYLIITIVPYLQLLLAGGGTSLMLTQMHYPAPFMVALIIASAHGLKKINTREYKQKNLLITIGLAAIVYFTIFVGPILPTLQNIKNENTKLDSKSEFQAMIPDKASLITTYDLLSHLSSRPQLYALNYVFTGKQQFSQLPYLVPTSTEYLLVDFTDLTTYQLQMAQRYPENYAQGDNRLRELIKNNNFGLVTLKNNLGLWKKDADSLFILYGESVNENLESNLNQAISLVNYETFYENNILDLKTFWQIKDKLEKNYHLKISDGNESILLPFGYGIFPTTEWEPEKTYQNNFRLSFKNKPSSITLEILDIDGYITLAGDRSVEQVLTEVKRLGEPIVIKID